MKKHITLIISLAIPVCFVLVLSIIFFVRINSIKPAHNFVYIIDPVDYEYSNSGERIVYKNVYGLKDNKIISKPKNIKNKPDEYETVIYKEAPNLYLYDIKNNTSTIFTFDEAQKLSLTSGPSSPDGYMLNYKQQNQDFFGSFDSENRGALYIIKNSAKKELPAVAQNNSHYTTFELIGWVK